MVHAISYNRQMTDQEIVVTDNSKDASKSRLVTSLQYLKKGDIKSSCEVLGITEDQALKGDFVNRMMAFEQGLNLLLSGRIQSQLSICAKPYR